MGFCFRFKIWESSGYDKDVVKANLDEFLELYSDDEYTMHCMDDGAEYLAIVHKSISCSFLTVLS